MIPLFGPNDAGKAALEKLYGYLDEAGRDRSSFGLEAQVNYGAGPDKWAAHADSWKELGADYVCVRTMNAGLSTPQAHIDAIREYARETGTSR
jgi:pyruvate/oxaloacetate carboxyltransferase